MPRFFLPEAQFTRGQIVELPTEVLRHLKTVLRLTVGAQCELFNGCGGVARGEILADFCVKVASCYQVSEPELHLTLIQGLPKGEKLELVLQKGTELGVNCFLPTRMRRSVGRLKPEREQKRILRWEKIILEAARQSGQPFLPRLQVEPSLTHALTAVEAELKLLLWEESAMPLEQALPDQCPQQIAVIVGPEGGITPEEAKQAGQAGYQSISLGPRILRTETAGLAIMTILQYLYGDLAKGRCSRDAAFQGKDES